MPPSTNYLLATIKSILHNEPMPATDASTSASSDAIDYTEVYRNVVYFRRHLNKSDRSCQTTDPSV